MSSPTPTVARRRRRPRRVPGARISTVHGRPLVYLDNAATTQKPRAGARRAPALLRARQRQRPSRRAHAERAGDRRLRGRAREGPRVHQRRGRRARSSSRATRPRASTWSRAPGATPTSAPATRCSSRRWSTTRTSCRGSCSASAPARTLRVVPIDDRGDLIMDEFERLLTDAHEDRRRRARVERARHDQSGRRDRARRRTAPAPPCWSTARRRRITCRSTSRRSAPTSTSSPATSSTGRPASACSTGGRRCSRRCRRSSAAAT